MNALLIEILQWLHTNGYRRASFDRLIGIIPSASTYDQLYSVVNENPMLFRTANIKGGLPGLAVLDEIDVGSALESYRRQAEEAEAPLTLGNSQDLPGLITKVTNVEIENEIVNEYYRNAGSAVKAPEGSSLYNVTLCILELRNGFVIIGKSACVDSRNFDEDLGRQLAREDAVKQVWPYLGFRLADKRLAA
jgi:hypothetical protein